MNAAGTVQNDLTPAHANAIDGLQKKDKKKGNGSAIAEGSKIIRKKNNDAPVKQRQKVGATSSNNFFFCTYVSV